MPSSAEGGILRQDLSHDYLNHPLLLRGVIRSLPWLGDPTALGYNLHSFSNLKVGPVLLLKL
jgi:hypothetical protein